MRADLSSANWPMTDPAGVVYPQIVSKDLND
jgi:hypothetical protein